MVLRTQLIPLRLIIIGKLVRSTSSELAVRIQRHYSSRKAADDRLFQIQNSYM